MDTFPSTPRDAAKVHGVLVTHERPAELDLMLRTLAAGTRRLDTLLVVDNSASPAVPETLQGARSVEYLATGENLGPAGGIALGMERVLQSAHDQDWVLVLDDDDPPFDRNSLEDLVAFGEECSTADSSTGAVGLTGGRFDPRTGEILRPRDDELIGPVPVDYIGGGQMPLYRVHAIRFAGTPLRTLFFGLDDLEYGLRMRRHGYHLYCDGGTWRRHRERHGRRGMPTSLRSSRLLPQPPWRTYYARRNHVFILRSHGNYRAAVRASAIALSKPFLNMPRRPRAAIQELLLALRAVTDGWFSRLGRRVEPQTIHAKDREVTQGSRRG